MEIFSLRCWDSRIAQRRCAPAQDIRACDLIVQVQQLTSLVRASVRFPEDDRYTSTAPKTADRGLLRCRRCKGVGSPIRLFGPKRLVQPCYHNNKLTHNRL